MARININFGSKTFYTLIAILSITILSVFVYAYKTGASPSIMGHSGEELEVTIANGSVTTLQNAITNNYLGGSSSSGVDCVTVDTLRGLLDGSNRQGAIDLRVNGRNICEDDNGCSYRVWKYTTTRPAGTEFFTSYPVMFRQREVAGLHFWYDAYVNGGQQGTNGDTSTDTRFVNWDQGLQIWDDKANIEQDPDKLAYIDTDSTLGDDFIITFCDI